MTHTGIWKPKVHVLSDIIHTGTSKKYACVYISKVLAPALLLLVLYTYRLASRKGPMKHRINALLYCNPQHRVGERLRSVLSYNGWTDVDHLSYADNANTLTIYHTPTQTRLPADDRTRPRESKHIPSSKQPGSVRRNIHVSQGERQSLLNIRYAWLRTIICQTARFSSVGYPQLM